MDFLPWLLLALPLLSAAAIQLGLKRSADLSAYVSTGSALATLVVTFLLLGKNENPDPFTWAAIGDFKINIGILMDTMSTRMMLVVTGIGSLVHLFSLVYMKDDEAKARYFSGLSLFMFSMTGIVLADNFLMMFMFWELVGLSSYLLIGHWYAKPSAAKAANKAFLTNRIGDFGFMIGILMIWIISDSVDFAGIQSFAASNPVVSGGLMTATVLCLFCGAAGKSAQFPLHVWLPDAMEGPTPVSALIHAATMVAAGVYMMARTVFALGDLIPAEAFTVIGYIGGITALLAALMAVQQDDIKKILAYSTLSQLGYMVMAIGLDAPNAGMFHLFTHAWFKALLFLGSGAVIYACHHEQNIWKMGGLLKKMPITGLTFLIGTAALIAVPGTSGFFSKEGILHAAHEAHSPLFWIAVGVAALTTFYMLRLVFVAFLGSPRGHGAEEAKEVGPLMSGPLLILAVMALISGYAFLADGTVPSIGFHAHNAVDVTDLAFICSVASLVIGAVAAFALYGKPRDKDPLSGNAVSKLFANRFYIDEIYDRALVKGVQGFASTIIHALDEFVINGLIIGGGTRVAQSFGLLFRRCQGGSLQAYAFFFGLGVIFVIYFTVFGN